MARSGPSAHTRNLSLQRRNLAKANLGRMARVRVTGLTETLRAARDAAPEIAKELKDELRAIAELAAQRARSNAPRRSGELAGSIKTKSLLKGAAIGSKLVYAPVIEFGHKRRHQHGGADHSHATPVMQKLTPQPYLMPAIDDVRPIAEQRAGDAVRRAARRLFEKVS